MTGLSIARLVSRLRKVPLFAETAGLHHKAKQLPTVHPKASNDIPTHSIQLATETTLPGDASPMADMNTYQMLDDVNLTIEAAHVIASTKAIAGYVNGKFANWPAIVAKYSKAGKFLLSIDVQGNPSQGAQCLDCEKGDVDPSNYALIVSWVKATAANGKAAKDLRFYPKVYTSEANAEAIVAALTAAGVARNTYMLWTAHYGEGSHICGPTTCKCPVQADATQWTDSADGVSLDESLCYGYFFAGPADAVPPAPVATVKLGTVAAKDMHAYASYRGVGLDWEAVKGATGYDVQLLEGTTQVGRTQVKSPKAAFPVKPSTEYKYRVAALPGGEWSAEATFKSAAPPAPKAAPVAPVADTGAIKITDPTPTTVTPVQTVTDTTAAPVDIVPQPADEPVSAATGSAGVLVYVQETLDADIAGKLGLPVGTILFIPHTVEGA